MYTNMPNSFTSITLLIVSVDTLLASLEPNESFVFSYDLKRGLEIEFKPRAKNSR
jgi:hypothetical protein